MEWDNSYAWFRNGKLHRVGGAAYYYDDDGRSEYYRNGKLDRPYGFAVEVPSHSIFEIWEKRKASLYGTILSKPRKPLPTRQGLLFYEMAIHSWEVYLIFE